MKTKLKVKKQAAHPKIMSKISLDIRVKRVMEELLPMLLGIQLLYGESPSQYLASLRLPYARKLILVLSEKGYITGDEVEWCFTKSTLEKVIPNLELLLGRRLSAIQNIADLEDPPVSLGALRRHYRELLLKVPKENWPREGIMILPHLRQLCRKYDSKVISKRMADFFKFAHRCNDYSMKNLEKFLKTAVK